MAGDYFISTITGSVIGSLIFIWHVPLGILLAKRLSSANCSNEIKFSELPIAVKGMQISAIIAYALLSLTGLLIIAMNIYNLYHGASLTVETDEIVSSLRIAQGFCVSLVTICGYFFMVCRLDNTFEDTVFAVKAYILKIHIFTCFLVMPIGMVSYSFMIVYGRNRVLHNIMLWTLYLIAVTALTHLFFAFNYGLFQVALQQRHCIEKKRLTEAGIELLAVVRKHSMIGVLFILLLISACLIYFIGACITGWGYAQSFLSTFDNSNAYYAIFDFLIICCMCISSLAMFLGFSVNFELYTKLCKVCDLTAALLCARLVQWKFGPGVESKESEIENIL